MRNLLLATVVCVVPFAAQADEMQNAACAGSLTWATQNYLLPDVAYDARNLFMQRFADDNGASFVSAFEHVLENMGDIEELGADLLADTAIDCLDLYAAEFAPNV